MPLRRSVKGRFPVTSSSSPSASCLWISLIVSLVMQASKLMKFKLLLTLYFKLLFYSVCLPLLAFVILFGNLIERCMIRRKRQQSSAEQVTAVTASVDEPAPGSSQTAGTKPENGDGSHMVTLVVSAVSRQEVIHMLQQKLGYKFRAIVSNGNSPNQTGNRVVEPTIWEEIIPRHLSTFASSPATTEKLVFLDNGVQITADVAIDVIRVNRHSQANHVTSSFLVSFKSSDAKFLNHALRAFDPTLTIRHEAGADDAASMERKSPEIWHQIEKLADLLSDLCQSFFPFRKKLLTDSPIEVCDREKVLAAFVLLGKELLMHVQSVTMTLKVLISQVMRRITCCNNYQFLLFKKLHQTQIDADNLSLAYSDCLPAELLKRIQESSGLTGECIALSCLTSALRAYAQEMTGAIPRDTGVFVQPCRKLDGLDGSVVVLPVESANDLVITSARVERLITESQREQESNERKKQLLMKTLPKFMFNWIQSLATSGHEIVIKSCHVEGDEQSFIRSVHHWPSMTSDTLLTLVVMHRKENVSFGVICKKDAIQSATLLAELVTKSVTNLCIAFRVQWDRRSPPSTPSDKSSQSP